VPANELPGGCQELVLDLVKGNPDVNLAHDANGPTQILVTKSLVPEKNTPFKNKKTPDIMRESIQKTVNTFSPYLKMPETISLEVVARRNIAEAAFNPTTNTIYTGEAIYYVDPKNVKKVYTHHPNKSLDVNNHEFGHAIFSANLLPLKPEVKFLYEFYLKQSSIYEEKALVEKELNPSIILLTGLIPSEVLAAKISELQHQSITANYSEVFYKWILEEVQSTDVEVINAKQKMQEYYPRLLQNYKDIQAYFMEKEISNDRLAKASDYYQGLSMYNEYFADVVAVLMVEKPDIISSATHYNLNFYSSAKSEDKLTGVMNKKFKHFTEQGAFRQFTDKIHTKGTASGPHGELWLARQFLWDEYLSHPTIMKTKKGEVLAGVFRAVIKSNDAMLSQVGPQAINFNENFIQFLKEELPK
jgi:hypothetical protein